MNTRILSRKNFLGLMVGIFMLMTLAAPSAHAVNLGVYYNFNQGTITFPQLSVAPGKQIGVPLNNSTDHPFPSGNLQALTTGGTTVNQATGDATGAGGVIDARGNNNTSVGAFCFVIGPFSEAGQTDVSLSFALESTGGFHQINLLYSTTGTAGSFINFGTITNVTAITTFATQGPFMLGTGADNQPTLFIEFCFTDVRDNDTHNNTFIDNIQITGVPEPGTVIGGAMGVLGLCWSQRRRLFDFLRFRRT
jgi:hypothetical protein